jgi:chromosome segregation protein
MRLKSIEVFGFKSFAEKTKIEFHDGITGIVGPNGCGKSNISDSFRWVLGEQSAKSMRGDKMYDIIFAGTAKRKPLNFAEVTLVLTDVNGTLPVEFEEVAVTRKLYRSGESDYFINRQPVRLKDVQSLFMDSGIGKDAFAIFEQGKIDQVINYNPLERRYIFEEAAGIVRFLRRKKEALRKLEQTEENILRLKDIHKEVERRIIVLEEQAEKAKVYKENKGRLEILEKGLFVAKWDNLQKRKGSIFDEQREQQEKIEALLVELKEKEKEIFDEKVFLEEGERKLRARSEGLYQVKSEKEIFIREELGAKKRIEEIAQELQKKRGTLQELNEQELKRLDEKKEKEEAYLKIKESFELIEQQRKEALERLSHLEQELAALRHDLQNEQKELMNLLRQEQQIESEMKQHTIRLEGNVSRQEQLIENEKKLSSHQKTLEEELKDKTEKCALKRASLSKIKEGLSRQDEELLSLKAKLHQKEEERHKFRREIAELEARHKVLTRLKNDMEGVSAGTKKLVQEGAKQTSPLFGKVKGLWEEIQAQAGQESGFSALMRPYAQTLVVQTEQDLLDLIQFAKENKLSDYSVICLQLLDGAGLQEHFLNGFEQTETFNLSLKKVNVFSSEGLYIDKNRVLFCTQEGEKNAFFREAELKKCHLELKKQSDLLKGIEEQILDLESLREEKLQERGRTDQAIRKEEMELVEMNVMLQRLQKDLEKTSLDQGKFLEDKTVLQQANEELKAYLLELKERHVKEKGQAETSKKRTEERSFQLEQLNEYHKMEQAKTREKETSYQKVIQDLRNLEHALDMIEVKSIESERQKGRLQEECSQLEKMGQELFQKQASCADQLVEIEDRLQEATVSVEELKMQVATRKQMIEKIENELAEQREAVKFQEQQTYQQGIKIAEIDTTRTALENELLDRYQLTIEDLKELSFALERSVEQSERELRQIRRSLEEAGDVNMTSIEEHAELKERYSFLNQQLDDLEASKVELVRIITELDTESRKIFKEVFETIRQNFQKNFKILFNGGEADLQLTESEDILEAGVEILAKPPGKQMRSIQLMSGGEKCLTSIALLFAIFEVKPSPFCILDEIDAPLDDINVDRFLNVVKQFTNRCQFIIITHNKRTMALADRLFGVSMEERGVSRLLAMEFSKEDSKEPILV